MNDLDKFYDYVENAYEFALPLGDYLRNVAYELETKKITLAYAINELDEFAKSSGYERNEQTASDNS